MIGASKHEIGHIALHSNTKHTHHRLYPDQLKIYSNDIEEVEANQFAGMLLMPAPIFKKQWHEDRCIEKIAWYFNVSKLAASVRANALGLMDL